MSYFVLYRLDWDAAKQKYQKQPCSLDGTTWPVSGQFNRTTHESATACLQRLDPNHYALGFWFMSELKLAFLDFDECVHDGVIDAEVQAIIAPFLAMGAFFEISTSGKGCHIVCRYSGELPPHGSKQPSIHKYEFYTDKRGMVFGKQQQGDWNVDCTLLLTPVIQEFFPADESLHDGSGTRRQDWDGPEDDEELIALMLASRQSAAVALGGKAGVRDLWAGNVAEHNSSADFSLALHLAFWTGCDAERMERLMRRSGLYRDKWDVHRTYLRELTILRACARTERVYRKPAKDMSAFAREYGSQQQLLVPIPVGQAPVAESDSGLSVDPQWWIDKINIAGTCDEIVDEIIPSLARSGIPTIKMERIAQTINKKLDLFDSKIPLPRLRALLSPPNLQDGGRITAPDWAGVLCYVLKGDRYYNTLTGSDYSAEGFRSEYSRMMPMKQNGDREDPVKWCRERWNMVVVDSRSYRPDQGQYFDWAGRRHANSFIASSVPLADENYTTTGAAAINRFYEHVSHLCGGRAEVVSHLLLWMAHNAQQPGRKIRWAPIIKGVPGDGKSVIGDVLRAALGAANIKVTAISSLTNSGGFTDWAVGGAVNIIEEIQLVGKERHKLFNAMKTFIADTVIDINGKGKANDGSIWNPTNHIAFTNFSDALPVGDDDRRWMVIFTPYTTINDVVRLKGLVSVDDLTRYIKMIGDVARMEPGQFRKWFLEMDTSSFNPDGRAPWTDEKSRMVASSTDETDDMVQQVIETGAYGVHELAFSSSCLQRALKFEAVKQGVELPQSVAWHHVLVRLGYEKLSKPIKWESTTHRVWVKSGKDSDNDEIREILDQTRRPLP